MNRAATLVLVALGIFAGSVGYSQETSEKDTGTTVPAKHVIVYKEAGRFCGWPANYGTWSWGNEILVGFRFGYYQEKDRGHSYNKDMPVEVVMSRSTDGGETWKLERPKGVDPKKKATECPGGIDFANPDFALRCRSEVFTVSYDRGKSWSDPYKLPGVGREDVMARTDYIVNGKKDCLILLTACKTNGKEGQPFCLRTTDGGKTLNFVSWIGPEPEGFSIMPATVRIGKNKLISAIRRKEEGVGFIDVYASNDNGESWELLSRPAGTGRRNGNPADMVRLNDGRVVLVYGYRSQPCGIRAVISRDNGKTWGKEIHLRDDGRTWDLGYPQMVLRPDGKLVTVYYYTTEKDKEQHIAATIWDPDEAKQ
ncbi:MAG: sialidase family protein [Planctomycetota bacterium]|jgi:hypothetical protein